MSLLFSMLSRFAIAFLPRSKCILISWLQSPSAVILEPKKIKFVTVSIVSSSICHEVMGLDAMIFIFLSWVLSQRFHSPLSPSSRGSLVSLSAIRVVSSWRKLLRVEDGVVWSDGSPLSHPFFCPTGLYWPLSVYAFANESQEHSFGFPFCWSHPSPEAMGEERPNCLNGGQEEGHVDCDHVKWCSQFEKQFCSFSKG